MLNTLNSRKFLLVLGDISLLYLSLFLAVFSDLQYNILPFTVLYLFWLTIFYIFGLYDLSVIRAKETFYTRVIGAIFTALAIGTSFFYLFPIYEVTPKTNLAINIIIFTILFLLWRKVFLYLFSSKFLSRVAIIGKAPQAQELIKEMSLRPYLGYKLVDLDESRNFLDQIKEKKIDTLLIPPDLVFDSELIKNLYQCLSTRVKFLDWTRAYEIITEKIPVSFINHLWFLENLGEGEKIFYDKLKRALDVIFSGIIFITTLPLWLLIAVLIKLEDGGPIIYSQKRIGKDGKPFLLFKFRSMTPEAERTTGPRWAQAHDLRATKIGKLLRKTHLDELPQMINILKGDVSLVGPRPERPEFVQQLEKEIPHYHLRHIIKSGFTGWAQIKFRYGRSVMDSQEKFQYDLYYLKNRSLFLDIGILLKTFQLFFKRD